MEKTLKIALKNKYGLHVRPTTAIAAAAAKFKAEIIVSCHGACRANARSTMELLALCAERGDELTFTARGEDAEEAIAAMFALVDGCFGGLE